jgi:glycosyltransferase involved in cell wall biosynthesis
MENAAIINDYPFVSVIMPVRNEAGFIERSLGAVLAQDYPPGSLEVVIADGISTDETVSIIEKLAAASKIPVYVVKNRERIAPTGLNRAIEKARGEIIVRVDGHCEIAPDYVKNCVRHLQENKAEGVGGPIETIGENLRARAIAIAMSSKFGVGGSTFRTVKDREVLVDTVAFPGYRRDVLINAGVFNEELVRNQDDEFNYRVRKFGGRILLAPDVRSRYYSRSGFRALWRQYFQYGYWKIRVLQLHPKQMSARQFAPFAFVSALIFMVVLSFFSSFVFWALLFTLGAYISANLLAALQTAGKIQIVGLPYVSLAFAILHFSYGIGFLCGLLAFRNRWREKTPSRPAGPMFCFSNSDTKRPFSYTKRR